MVPHAPNEAAAVTSSPYEREAREHGVYMAREVVQTLETAGYICCVTGIKALAYYGAPRPANDWRICVPDNVHAEAIQLIDGMQRKYRRVDPPPPELLLMQALWHEYPHFRPVSEEGDEMSFFIMPSSEEFFQDLDASIIERSKNHIPYPTLEVFAQNLVGTQQWNNLEHLIDGMDLSSDWGHQHLRLGFPSAAEVGYAKMKNSKYAQARGHLPQYRNHTPVILSDSTALDRTRRWDWIVSKKLERIDPYLVFAGFKTRHRAKDSGDPRLDQHIPV